MGLGTEKSGDTENRWGVKVEGKVGRLTIATVTQDMDSWVRIGGSVTSARQIKEYKK